MTRDRLVWTMLLIAVTASPAFAQAPQLKDLVILIGASDGNDALSKTVSPGPVTQALTLRVTAPAPAAAQQGELAVTELTAQQEPVHVVPASLRVAAGPARTEDARRLPVSLAAPGWMDIELRTGPLRSGTTYKGRLVLAAGTLLHRWEVTLAAGGRGILAVDGVGTVKLVAYHPCAWFAAMIEAAERCAADTRSFSVTLRDKSEQGPYNGVRVRFEPAGGAAGKSITSNFSLDTISFWSWGPNRSVQPLDLANRSRAAVPASTLDIARRGQQTIVVRADELSPGDYAGTLRFVAANANDEAADNKLALALQVRHHWTLPVLVIVLGSVIGWLSSKYIVAVRRAKALSQQVALLRARANDLARPNPGRGGWHFPPEGGSYALGRVRVILHQLARLSRSPLRVMVAETEIQERTQDAQRRLAGLEKLRAVRLKVEAISDGRPAAQITLGRLLREARGLLERASYGDTEQAGTTTILDGTSAWLAADTATARYREAIRDRLHGREFPDQAAVRGMANAELRDRILALIAKMPDDNKLGQADAPLQEYDRWLAELVLLWRERDFTWATDLAQASTKLQALEALFDLVDTQVWKKLNADRTQLIMQPPGTDRVETQDLVEVKVESNVPDLPVSRIVYHPLRVEWKVTAPPAATRREETDGLALVQYFPAPGPVTIGSVLRWKGLEVPVSGSATFSVVDNPDYRSRAFFAEWSEHGVTALAVLFAVLTAMGTLYDATFGSFGQYLSLFLWSAGASAGGNMFKQLGTTPTPTAGGSADAALPAARTN